ncbi:hypothetical protein ACFQ05_02240 [Amycolatopsis umgeniensis]|uniref:Uncharacterized protein YjbI with pentapeptide repeats n=1 Tax=Amycolatopsis umgeniensis TaxID=336628 RepID=A0A841AYQ7_9PSEU|nr:hypothetical protein [Amycolatopsis umgeniensis]MBB5852077.1 uncharacterized protein YjbI with pentapeptide repeats [Amycolatopsis umgeniensis]
MRSGPACLTPDELSAAELELVECSMTGNRWEAANATFGPVRKDEPSRENHIRAQVLYQLLSGHGELSVGEDGEVKSVRAVRLYGATIPDHLDLRGVVMRCPLELVSCRFTYAQGPVLFRDASAPYVRLNSSVFRGGIDAHNLTVDGDFECGYVKSDKTVNLLRSRIRGAVSFRGAELGALGLQSLSLEDAEVGGSVFCDAGFRSYGSVTMFGVRVNRSLEFSGGKFVNPGATCLSLDRATIKGAVFARSGFSSEGQVSLHGAIVDGVVYFDGARLECQGGTALNLSSADIGDLRCGAGFEANGMVDLSQVEVANTVNFDGGRVYSPGLRSVNADGANIGGSAFFRSDFRSDGELRLLGATVGKQLNFDAGEFVNPGQHAIAADHLRVGGSLYFRDGARADGTLRFAGVAVEGQFGLNGATVESDALDAVSLRSASIKGDGVLLPAALVGNVDLRGASFGRIWDNERFRASRVLQDGLKYESLHPEPPAVTVQERLRMISGDPEGYAAQPYSQLARTYRDKGYAESARKVLVEAQKVRLSQASGWRGVLSFVWSAFFGSVTGYGYRPWLAAGWSFLVLVVGTVSVDLLSRRSPYFFEKTTGAPDFHPILYVIDTMIPFIDFGYGKWVAHGVAQFLASGLVIVGWVVATMLVVAFTAVLRRGE